MIFQKGPVQATFFIISLFVAAPKKREKYGFDIRH